MLILVLLVLLRPSLIAGPMRDILLGGYHAIRAIGYALWALLWTVIAVLGIGVAVHALGLGWWR